MSIDIRDNQSLLTSLLTQSVKSADSQPSAKPRDGIFAGRLDQALGSTEPSSPRTRHEAQALAEALNLQMLHSTLSMGGSPDESPRLFDQQSPQFQSLVRAYTANQPESSVPQSAPSAEKPSQLQDLAEVTVESSGKQAQTLTQGTQWLESIISKASTRYGVDAGLIKAVIKTESGFNPNAVSHAGAQGLMQLMPGTARSLGVNDSFDPEQNVMAGTRFLRDLLKRYNGNLDSALAAYNWGPGNVDRRPEHLPRETREYLVRVKQSYNSYTA